MFFIQSQPIFIHLYKTYFIIMGSFVEPTNVAIGVLSFMGKNNRKITRNPNSGHGTNPWSFDGMT